MSPEEDGEDKLDRAVKRNIIYKQGGKESPPYSKTKEGKLDTSHHAYELPSLTCY